MLLDDTYQQMLHAPVIPLGEAPRTVKPPTASSAGGRRGGRRGGRPRRR
jgi:hypothetical protein